MKAFATHADGSPLGSHLGGDRFSNFVCPPGGLDGAPPGFNPNVSAAVVCVDPGSSESFMIEPSKLTKQALAQAAVNHPVRGAGLGLEDARLSAFAGIAQAARQSGAILMKGEGMISVPPQQPFQAFNQPTPTQQMPVPQQQMPQQQMPKQAMPQQQQPQPSGNMFPTPAPSSLFSRARGVTQPLPQQVAPAIATAPTHKVKFEIENNPLQFEGWFHDIVLDDAVIVFIFDRRAIGFPCQWPPSVADQIVAELTGQGKLVILGGPQYKFQFQHYEMCVMTVIQTVIDPPQ